MRASRLVALLLTLQARGRTTAAQLAAEHEVSVRTIYRDIASLQAAGVPIWTEPGPAGGIRLLDGWTGRLEELTVEEAGALFLAGAAARSKVLASLPRQQRAGRVRDRFHVDAPGWFHREEPVPHLDTVAAAVWSGRRLAITYRGHRRTLDPLGLVVKAGIWYLVAAHRDRPATWRVGRIEAAEMLDEPAARPDAFDLPAWWASSAQQFDRSMRPYRVQARLSRHALWLLPHLVGDTIEVEPGEADEEGWHEVELLLESLEVAADQLSGLGAGVEILDPPELRAAVAVIGEAMAARNKSRHGAHPDRA